MIGTTIFYSNQIAKRSNCFISSTPKRCSEVQGFIFSCLIVDGGFQLSLTMTSLVLFACNHSNHASKEVWEIDNQKGKVAKDKDRGHNVFKTRNTITQAHHKTNNPS
jgi:hypothetical protein